MTGLLGSNLGKVCSHPGRPLEDHLSRVLSISLEIADRFGIELSPRMREAILLHDLGKAHPLFQAHICRVCPARGTTCFEYERSVSKKYGHAEPSAALVFALTKDAVAAEIVRRHHTGLEDLSEASKFWIDYYPYKEEDGDSKGPRSIWDSLSHCRWWQGAAPILAKIGQPPVPASWTRFLPDKERWEDCVFDTWQDLAYGGEDKSLLWVRTREAYSVLVTADRWDASTAGKVIGNSGGAGSTSPDIPFEELHLDTGRISSYLKDRTRREVDGWREHVRNVVTENALKLITKPGLYTLTLPTGTGKTLIGMQIAMDVAKRFKATGIVYCLPFISVVDQNADVAKKIFDDVQEDHHMAYTRDSSMDAKSGKRDADGDETLTPAERFIAFFRYWRSPVVITTLAKLWEVLYSPRANDTMSFHRLSRAIVIIDEPQSIPAGFWDGLGKTLRLLAKEMQTTFILMTATQPHLGEGLELVQEEFCFPRNRYRVEWLGESKGKWHISDLIQFCIDAGIREKDTLVVVNTKEAALRVYCELRRLGIKPLLISRWLTPSDRRKVLAELERRERAGERRCVVATQVIEAGMDFDFELVLRDLGPLDSIVQVAGRCNRHGAREGLGRVVVFDLVKEGATQERSYSSDVYDSVLLSQTRNVLGKYQAFDESYCREVVEKYYDLVHAAVKPADVWDNLVQGNWGQYKSLITNETRDEVALLIDPTGSLAQKYREISELGKGLEEADRRRSVFRLLSDNSIDVRRELLEAWKPLLGANIVSSEKPKFEPLNDDMWVLNEKGPGMYLDGIGFVPVELWDEYRGELKAMP